MRPSQQWIAPSSPSATQAAVSLAISSRLICAARGPFAALAQDVRHARHARHLDAALARRLAQVERAVQRLLGAREVRRVVQRDAEPLVEVRGDGRQVVFECQRQCGLDGRKPGFVFAVLGPRHAFEPERAQAQVETIGAVGLLPRDAGQHDRLGVLRRDAALVGHREVLDRSLGRRAVGGERLGRPAAGPERGFAITAQLEHGGEAALRRGSRQPRQRAGELTPRARRLRQLARQLGAAGVALERLQPQRLVLSVGPQVERLAAGGSRVAKGVHRLGLERRRAEAPRARGRCRERRASAPR